MAISPSPEPSALRPLGALSAEAAWERVAIVERQNRNLRRLALLLAAALDGLLLLLWVWPPSAIRVPGSGGGRLEPRVAPVPPSAISPIRFSIRATTDPVEIRDLLRRAEAPRTPRRTSPLVAGAVYGIRGAVESFDDIRLLAPAWGVDETLLDPEGRPVGERARFWQETDRRRPRMGTVRVKVLGFRDTDPEATVLFDEEVLVGPRPDL